MFLKEIFTHRISKTDLYASLLPILQLALIINIFLELAGLKGSYLGFKLFSDKASHKIKRLRKMLF